MELRACCKINLGLRIARQRADGFHDIETAMYPVRGLFDTVSLVALPGEATFLPTTPPPYPPPMPVFATDSVLETSGNAIDCHPEQNICMRALRLVQREFGIGEAMIRLHKTVPSGAGLGGGSSDAAAVLRALDEEFVLQLTDDELESLGAELGSDVPFFIRNTPRLCVGRGEIMTPMGTDLSGMWLAIVKPPVSVSTAEAYSGAVPRETLREMPKTPATTIPEILNGDIAKWRELLVNDFEPSVFARHPEIADLKRGLYSAGAVYASMSGSGSAVYGLFDERPRLSDLRLDKGVFRHIEQL